MKTSKLKYLISLAEKLNFCPNDRERLEIVLANRAALVITLDNDETLISIDCHGDDETEEQLEESLDEMGVPAYFKLCHSVGNSTGVCNLLNLMKIKTEEA